MFSKNKKLRNLLRNICSVFFIHGIVWAVKTIHYIRFVLRPKTKHYKGFLF